MKKTAQKQLVILITSCSTGIGRAMAINLEQLGHTVYAGVRKTATLDSIASDRLIPVSLEVNDLKNTENGDRKTKQNLQEKTDDPQ